MAEGKLGPPVDGLSIDWIGQSKVSCSFNKFNCSNTIFSSPLCNSHEEQPTGEGKGNNCNHFIFLLSNLEKAREGERVMLETTI